MFKSKKGMEPVANEDPTISKTNTLQAQGAGTSRSDQITVQISLSENNQSPRSTASNVDPRFITDEQLDKRITSADGDLQYNPSKTERAEIAKIDEKLTTMAEEGAVCSHEEWDALLEQQCPLPPRSYKYKDKIDGKVKEVNTTARVYFKRFWIRHPDTGVIYEAITKEKEVKKHQERLNQMRAVDEYLLAFHLTSSVQIYKRFKKAVDLLEDSSQSKKAKKKEEIAYKLIPGWTDRISFFGTLARALLNALFIYFNINSAFTEDLNWFYFSGILITACAEAYLFLVAFLRSVYNTWSLLKRVLRNDTVHFQTKNMPMQIREMASISILRFLPSGESTNRMRKRWKEWWGEIMEDYRFAVENARKHNTTVKIRETINIGFIIAGPILAILALIFKVTSINLELDALFNPSYSGHENVFGWLYYIIIYLGFVNQIAGIRKVRLIEMQALQHFVFSGNDVKLSRHERQMMNVWWNYTIVSCVSNICEKFKYPVFDSVVFWYQLNPRKLQILLKNHDAEGEDYLKTRMKKGKRIVEVTPRQDYDKNVFDAAKEKRAQSQRSDSVADDIKNMDDDDHDTKIITTDTYVQHHPASNNEDNNDDNNNDDNNNDDNNNDDIQATQPIPSQAGQTSTTGKNAAVSIDRNETDVTDVDGDGGDANQ